MAGHRKGTKLCSLKTKQRSKADVPISISRNGNHSSNGDFIRRRGQQGMCSKKLHSLIEIIEISSSCPKSPIKDLCPVKKVEEDEVDSPSQASTPIESINGFNDIKAAFSNMVNTIITHNPNLCFDISPSGLPVLTTNPTPPMLHSFQNMPGTALQTQCKQTIPYKAERHERSRHETHMKKNLFSKFEECGNRDFYVNFKPLPGLLNDRTSTDFFIPKWVPISFNLPADMNLEETEAALISYIFRSDDDIKLGSEILIRPKYGSGDRKTLKTLMPKGCVDQEVLNLLACRLKYEDTHFAPYSTMWFMPTMFSQFALDWDYEAVKGFYQSEFMGKVDYLTKIVIPMNDLNVHWYLLIVDVDKRKLVLLDSSPSKERNEFRCCSVKKVALFLEDVFVDILVDDKLMKYKYDVSAFTLVVPPGVPHQKLGSNDCGVWVSQWMIECAFSDDYEKVFVRPDSRMRLAIELISHPFNELKASVEEKAIQHWIELKRKNGTVGL